MSANRACANAANAHTSHTCTCTRTYTYTCACARSHARTHTYTHKHARTCTHTRHIRTHAHTHTCMRAHLVALPLQTGHADFGLQGRLLRGLRLTHAQQDQRLRVVVGCSIQDKGQAWLPAAVHARGLGACAACSVLFAPDPALGPWVVRGGSATSWTAWVRVQAALPLLPLQPPLRRAAASAWLLVQSLHLGYAGLPSHESSRMRCAA